MTTFELDRHNNLIFGNNFSIISDEKAIIQDVKNLLLMWITEYPFDINEGLNWYELSTYNNKNEIIQAVKERLLTDNRIFAVNKLDVTFTGRNLNISAELETDLGIINV